MQNDILYNQVMKKILVIDVTIGEDMNPAIVGANMKPSEVMQPGMMPIIAFQHMYVEGAFDSYASPTQIGYESGDFYIRGAFDIVADTVNNEWVLA